MDGKHDALINLLTAAAANRETMMSQCKTIAYLTASVADLTQQLHQTNTVHTRGSGIPVYRQVQEHHKWLNERHVRDVVGY